MYPSQDQGAPEQRRPDRRRQRDRTQPQPQLHPSQQRPIALAHPVIAGYNGSPSARNALYSKAERILLDEAPVIPLYHYTHVFLIRPSVRGWSPTLLDHHPYKDVWLGDD